MKFTITVVAATMASCTSLVSAAPVPINVNVPKGYSDGGYKLLHVPDRLDSQGNPVPDGYNLVKLIKPKPKSSGSASLIETLRNAPPGSLKFTYGPAPANAKPAEFKGLHLAQRSVEGEETASTPLGAAQTN